MIKKLEGLIIYLHFDEVNQYYYKENELENYNSQQLKGGMITSIKNEGVKKAIFEPKHL